MLTEYCTRPAGSTGLQVSKTKCLTNKNNSPVTEKSQDIFSWFDVHKQNLAFMIDGSMVTIYQYRHFSGQEE